MILGLIPLIIFPFTLIFERMFLSITKRKPSDVDANFWNELILFILTCLMLDFHSKNYGVKNSNNPYSLLADDMNNS